MKYEVQVDIIDTGYGPVIIDNVDSFYTDANGHLFFKGTRNGVIEVVAAIRTWHLVKELVTE